MTDQQKRRMRLSQLHWDSTAATITTYITINLQQGCKVRVLLLMPLGGGGGGGRGEGLQRPHYLSPWYSPPWPVYQYPSQSNRRFFVCFLSVIISLGPIDDGIVVDKKGGDGGPMCDVSQLSVLYEYVLWACPSKARR